MACIIDRESFTSAYEYHDNTDTNYKRSGNHSCSDSDSVSLASYHSRTYSDYGSPLQSGSVSSDNCSSRIRCNSKDFYTHTLPTEATRGILNNGFLKNSPLCYDSDNRNMHESSRNSNKEFSILENVSDVSYSDDDFSDSYSADDGLHTDDISSTDDGSYDTQINQDFSKISEYDTLDRGMSSRFSSSNHMRNPQESVDVPVLHQMGHYHVSISAEFRENNHYPRTRSNFPVTPEHHSLPYSSTPSLSLPTSDEEIGCMGTPSASYRRAHREDSLGVGASESNFIHAQDANVRFEYTKDAAKGYELESELERKLRYQKERNVFLQLENNTLQTKLDSCKKEMAGIQSQQNIFLAQIYPNKSQRVLSTVEALQLLKESFSVLSLKLKELTQSKYIVEDLLRNMKENKQITSKLREVNAALRLREQNNHLASMKQGHESKYLEELHLLKLEAASKDTQITEIIISLKDVNIELDNVKRTSEIQIERLELQLSQERSMTKQLQISALSDCERIEELQHVNTSLHTENGQLHADLTRQLRQLDNELDQFRNKDLSDANKLERHLARDIQTKKGEIEHLTISLDKLHKRYQTVKEEKGTAMKQSELTIKALENQLKTKESDIETLNNEKEQLKRTLQQRNQRIQDLEQLTLSLRQEKATIKRDSSEVAKLKAEIVQKDREMSRLAELDGEKEISRDRIAHFESNAETYRERIESLQNAIKKHREENKKSKASLQKHNQRIRELERQLELSRNEKESINRRYSIKVKDLKAIIAKKDNEISRFTDLTQKSDTHESNAVQYKKNIEELRNSIKQLKDDKETSEKTHFQRVQDYEQQLVTLQNEKKAMVKGHRLEVEKLTTGITKSERELSRLRNIEREKQNGADRITQLELEAAELTKRIEKQQKSIRKLKDDKENAEKTQQHHIKRVRDLEQQLRSSQIEKKSTTDRFSRHVEELRADIEKKDDEVKRLTELLKKDSRHLLLEEMGDRLRGSKDCQSTVTALMEQNAVLIDRLSVEMNSKVSANESSLENISIQARPMNVAEAYNILMSNSWLDAKTTLDEHTADDERLKVEFLLTILQVSEQQSKQIFDNIISELSNVLHDPVQWMEELHGKAKKKSKTSTGQNSLPQNVTTVIGDLFRNFANRAHLEFLIERVREKVKKTHSGLFQNIDFLLKTSDINEYMVESTKLAWKMALQRPPMNFDASHIGKPWSGEIKDSLDLMWGSNPNAKGAAIKYYKNPRLFHGDKIMAKGSVLVDKK